jgi:hypothetical protein
MFHFFPVLQTLAISPFEHLLAKYFPFIKALTQKIILSVFSFYFRFKVKTEDDENFIHVKRLTKEECKLRGEGNSLQTLIFHVFCTSKFKALLCTTGQ